MCVGGLSLTVLTFLLDPPEPWLAEALLHLQVLAGILLPTVEIHHQHGSHCGMGATASDPSPLLGAGAARLS